VIDRRIGADDEIDLLVVERHDYAERPNEIASLRVARCRLIEERLIDVRLHHGELHTRLEAQTPDVLGRARRGQNLQRDVRLGRYESGQVAADLNVGSALGCGNDLVIDFGPRHGAGEQRCSGEDRAQSPGHVISPALAGRVYRGRAPRCLVGTRVRWRSRWWFAWCRVLARSARPKPAAS